MQDATSKGNSKGTNPTWLGPHMTGVVNDQSKTAWYLTWRKDGGGDDDDGDVADDERGGGGAYQTTHTHTRKRDARMLGQP